MIKKLAKIVACAGLVTAVQSCRTSGSDVNATNQFKGETLSYWYEMLSFKEGDPFNFIDYHRTYKDLLMGNADGGLLPETLKGVWFMDGNPLSDKTLELARVSQSDVGGDFKFKVGDPQNFTWVDLPNSHKMNQAISKYDFTYEVEFHDCPADVKKEREVMWGMANGSCAKADREFATITPYLNILGRRTKIGASVAYFDMYLRPKTGDFYIWERRSKLFKAIDPIVAAITHATQKNEWHRYKFTQILDKEAKPLQSYPHFIDSLKDYAQQNKLVFERMIWTRCPDGADGCSRQILRDSEVPANFVSPAGAEDFGAMPML